MHRKYSEKCKAANPSKKVLMELSWERVEFNELLQQCKCLLSHVKTVKASVGQSSRVMHVQKSMEDKKSDWEKYLRDFCLSKEDNLQPHMYLFFYYLMGAVTRNLIVFPFNMFPTIH